jgi:hypothetical protein
LQSENFIRLVIPITWQDMKAIVLSVQAKYPARTRPWGWKGHYRVLKSSVFLQTGGKKDDEIVLRGYGSDL